MINYGCKRHSEALHKIQSGRTGALSDYIQKIGIDLLSSKDEAFNKVYERLARRIAAVVAHEEDGKEDETEAEDNGDFGDARV